METHHWEADNLNNCIVLSLITNGRVHQKILLTIVCLGDKLLV